MTGGHRGLVDASRADSVSIIVPVRDEEERVGALVAAIADQDFAGELELLVADGGSRDRSVERLSAAAELAGLQLTIIPNRAGRIPHGLNACVQRARGDLILRMDCRGRYPRDYVSRCAAAARETGAWNVGGVLAPEGSSRTERAAACAITSPFGGIAWTRHAARKERVDVDTVYCGTFRRGLFRVVGLFDESLPWNEDDDLNFRIRRAGGRVVLDPTIRIGYTPRRSLRAVVLQYYRYGHGKAGLMRKHGQVISTRSLAPLALVGSLAAMAIGSTCSSTARRLLAAEGAIYLGAGVVFAWRSLSARDEPRSLLPLVVAVFAAMHGSYGVGMAHGALRAANGLRRSPAAAARAHG
jgi:succinoglycan biosynthesis protein ExoA